MLKTINEFLPLTRSYNMDESRYFTEPSLILLNSDTFYKKRKYEDSRIKLYLDYMHESIHSSIRNYGISKNQIQFFCNTFTEILRIKNKIDVDAIINYELANEMLHVNSVPLQEALAAYEIDACCAEWENSHDDMKNICIEVGIPEGEFQNVSRLMQEIMPSYGSDYKRSILRKKKIKLIYDELISQRENSRSFAISRLIANTSLDLPNLINPMRVISEDPIADVGWRFDTIIQSLKSAKQNKRHLISIITQFDFEKFIENLTGIKSGLIDSLPYKDANLISTISFSPYHHKKQGYVAKNSIKSKYGENKPNSLNNYFSLYGVCTAFCSSGKVDMIVNDSVDESITKIWIKNFLSWLTKESIINNYDMDEMWNCVTPLDGTTNPMHLLDSIQGTIEFESAAFYDDLFKLKKVRN